MTLPTVVFAMNPELSLNNPAAPGTMDATCEWYTTEFSNAGTAIACPLPPAANTATSSTIASTTTATTTASSSPITTYGPFQIDITSATQLLLNDRTPAILANITPGDTINVFGYYDGTNTVEAEVLRDLSKPAVGVVVPTGIEVGTSVSVADIQAEISQIETLLSQLVTQIDALTTSSSTASSTSM